MVGYLWSSPDFFETHKFVASSLRLAMTHGRFNQQRWRKKTPHCAAIGGFPGDFIRTKKVVSTNKEQDIMGSNQGGPVLLCKILRNAQAPGRETAHTPTLDNYLFTMGFCKPQNRIKPMYIYIYMNVRRYAHVYYYWYVQVLLGAQFSHDLNNMFKGFTFTQQFG